VSALVGKRRQQQENLSETPLAGVENLGNKIPLETDIARKQMGHEKFPTVVLFVKPARHEFRVAVRQQLGGLAFRFLVPGLVRFAKLFDLSFSFGLSDTVSLLYLSYELVALAG
jgi:hypothetical protein